MAHDHIKEQVQIEADTGWVSLQIIATLLGGVLLICALIAHFLYQPSPGYDNDYATTLALLSAILLGMPLVAIAINDLARGHYHMNELVALAVLSALVLGKYVESASIAFFMYLAVLIESRTALGAKASIESLVRITPTRAHRLRGEGGISGGSGGEDEVDAKELRAGDLVRVRPGDNIPADGQIVSGESTVNQANITGESLPADKQVGDEVFGGTINLTGVMDIRVTKAGEDTTLGRVKDLIQQAEKTRIPIMRMIDRYAAWYTPTVLMVAGIVLFLALSNDLESPWERAIALLVVACPCPIILATPTAMVAALSAAARLGVLVKSANDLERARNLTAMIFDKTGTLTTGELEVTRLAPRDGIAGVDLLLAAAAVEQNSRHPVARAVTNVARKAKLNLGHVQDFAEVSGKGVQATVAGAPVLVGRASWVGSQLTDPEQSRYVQETQQSPEAEGLSTLFVVKDGQVLGWIGLADNTRPQAAAAMDELREIGIKRLIIVTGDRESVAKRVAAQMHTEYQAEVLPHQKLEMVDELRGRGHRVAVIGDGVNDAPALAAGDISIAMGAAGSDVAIHSASIALMNNNLNRIPFLIRLSRATGNVILQNLIIGGGFIVVFMALAAMGYVTPIAAAVLHVVSSLIVVFNSARLVRQGESIEHAEAEALAHVGGGAPTQPREERPAASVLARPQVAL
jgi:Cd2+/Zn2+-exporting ATPase